MSQVYGSIYVIKNKINEKVYVGQTVKSVQHRFLQHLRRAYDSKFHDSQEFSRKTKLSNAINLYGKDNFYVKKIKECRSKDELDYYEEKYIELYDSVRVGYNIELKPRGTGSKSEDTKEKLSIIKSVYKSFYIYNLDGILIGKYDRVKTASENLNLTKIGIYECLLQKKSRYLNYICIFESEFTENELKRRISNASEYNKRVSGYNIETGECVGHFNNAVEAANILNICHTSVYAHLTQKRNRVDKYIFVYTKDVVTPEKLFKLILNANSKKIYCSKNGKIYDNIYDITKDLHIDCKKVLDIIYGKEVKQKYKLRFV